MYIQINGYKNLLNFEYNIIDGKTNFLYGISGSGKTSIVQALLREDIEFNKSIGFNDTQSILVDGNDLSASEILFFNDDSINSFISNPDLDNMVYDVIFDDMNEINSASKNLDLKLQRLKEKIEFYNSYYKNLKDIQSSLGATLTNNNSELRSTCSLTKLKNSILNNENKRLLSEIKLIPSNKFLWIIQGIDILNNEPNCPFCLKKINTTRRRKLQQYKSFDNKSISSISSNINSINTITSNTYDLNNSGVNLLYREMVKIANSVKDFEYIQDFLRKFYYDNLLSDTIIEVEVSDYFYEYFKDLKPIITDINRNIQKLKQLYFETKSKTNSVLSRRTSKINKLIKSLGIPYEISIKYSNKKISEYKLIHIDENNGNNRTSSLSKGEKNLISLIFFILLGSNLKEKKLIIIDDPVSSFDEYRRSTILDYIKNELKNRTILILSHDPVLAKLAVHKKNKFIGNIDYFNNLGSTFIIKAITKSDFGNYFDFILERCKLVSNYYQKIINLRLFYEGKYNDKAYGYLSAILHKYPKEVINNLLLEKEQLEQDILDSILLKTEIKLPFYSDELLINTIDISSLTIIEKAIYLRENHRELITDTYVKEEINNLIHINDKLSVCLNPFEFIFCTKYTLSLISNVTF
jgi:ABC-type lipoprotein export system ATPase subunit